MPLPLALLPVILFLAPLVLFILLRWWIGKTGPTILLTSSLILNFTLFSPLVLAALLALEVRDFQEKMSTAPKLLLVEKGADILLAVSFTEVKDLEKGFSSFQPLAGERLALVSGLGEARYQALARDYYKVFVVKGEFLKALATPVKPPPASQGVAGGQGPLGLPGPAAMDPAAILGLLGSTREAFTSGELDRVARQAVDLQKAFGERGMGEAAGLARQMEQAAKAGDTKTLEALGARLAQQSPPGSGGLALPGLAALLTASLSGDTILKAIEAEEPAKALSPYLPAQALQEISGGDATGLKLALVAFLVQSRGFDPLLLLREYQAEHILVYPASTISTLAKLLPLALLPGG